MARTTRPTTRALALAQQARVSQQEGRHSSALTRVLANHDRKLSRREEKLAAEVYTRLGAGQGALIVHEFATQALSQAHVQTLQGFSGTVRQLNAVKNSVYWDPETAQDIADFVAAEKEMARRHFASNLEGVAAQLIGLARNPLYEEERDEPRGFFARLFGG